jgi:hypothetical protein
MSYKMFDPRDLVETALRILVVWNGGGQPAKLDVDKLRAAFPSFATKPADELACQVVHDLASRAFPRPESDGQISANIRERVA